MVVWNATLETGNAVVDNDHKILIKQVNDLGEALKAGTAKEQLTTMIAFLNKYTREHFAREEQIMKDVKCPTTGQNCTAHRALVAKLDGWVARLNAGGPSTTLVLEIYKESSDWLRSHIVGIDSHLKRCA
jgi:hemerythrin